MSEVDDLAASSTTKRLSWSSSDAGTPRTPAREPCVLSEEESPYGPTSSSKTDETADSLMSLTEIEEELQEIIVKVNKGEAFDEKRLDFLIAEKNDHPEHQMNLERENREWMLSIEDFLAESLAKTRSFLPVEISRLGSAENVVKESGLSMDMAKRVLEEKALWLCRMKDTDISRIHIVDLLHKYNPMGINLDIIETAAVFACMPEHFNGDTDGRKEKFREDMIATLKGMMSDQQNGKLSAIRCRHPVYGVEGGGGEFGPIEDITSTLVSRVHSVSGISQDELDGKKPRRRSFTEVCKRHSLLGRERRKRDGEEEEGSSSGSESGSEYSLTDGERDETKDGNKVEEKEKEEERATPSPKDILKHNTRRNSSGSSGKKMAAAYNAQTSDGTGSGTGSGSGSGDGSGSGSGDDSGSGSNNNNTSGIMNNPQSVSSLGGMVGAGSRDEENEETPREAASPVPEPKPEPLGVAPVELTPGGDDSKVVGEVKVNQPEPLGVAPEDEEGEAERNKGGLSEKSAYEKGSNLYVEYGGDDLVHYGWLHRGTIPPSTNTSRNTTFTRYFVVCTRSDSFLRVFDREADVEEAGTINLQNFSSCVRAASLPMSDDDEEEEEEEEGVWRDSTAHTDQGSDHEREEKEDNREANGPPFYFVLSANETAVAAAGTKGTETGEITWYFRCDNAAVADQWIEKLQPLLRKKDKELK